ncbi:hypothetical protein GCM10010406_37430 [Streptomyces thermolineatus]|uniref:Uncharacterized protein n=1 Tax=Streptomyces thermolineatus TaxID=44033 RepID=A0ABN3M8N9_9ACTN
MEGTGAGAEAEGAGGVEDGPSARRLNSDRFLAGDCTPGAHAGPAGAAGPLRGPPARLRHPMTLVIIAVW